jgi:ribosome-binding protein aMBF1 (putative translation factor)
MSHQDWQTVTFTNKKSSGTLQTKETAPKKPLANIQAIKVEQLADQGDTRLEKKMIDTKAVSAVIKKRSELKLTQTELANKINISPNIIKSLEQNKEQHNPGLLSKLQKVLGIKLLGANIGEPL